MAKERITADEIDAAIRNARIGRVEEVPAVVLETGGSMSVIHRTGEELTALRSLVR